MEQTDNIIALLELIPNPGFCVRDGFILHINQAASSLPLKPGDAVSGFLATGTQEYAAFQDGVLSLTLLLNRQRISASVIRMEGADLFLIDHEAEQGQLQALALAAQQLRGPLSSVVTSVDYLESALPENIPGVKGQKAKLNHSLYQLLRMIFNMSDAFLHTQKPITKLEIRDIPRIFDELFEKSTALLSQAGITLHYSGIQESVIGLVDTEKLERAAENLLANAIKHTPTGGSVFVRLSRNDSMLCLTVEDQGDGIREDVRQSLYSRYLRQPGLGDSRDGIGLGLTLVRAIAALHGGTLLAQPAKDRGSRFTMTIAIRQKSDTALQSPMFHIDYSGGRDPMLLELSEVLPSELYE